MASAGLRRLVPRSLRRQLTLALASLSALVVASSVTAIHALRASAESTRALAEERMVRLQQAQDLVERALLAERALRELLTTPSPDGMREAYAEVVRELEAVDRLVDGLAGAGVDPSVLDLHRSVQLFRSTTHVVARLREAEREAGAAFAASLEASVASLERRGGPRALALAVRLQRLRDAGRPDVEALRGELLRGAPELRDDPAAVAPGAADPFAARLTALERAEAVRRFSDELERHTVTTASAAKAVSAHLGGEYRAAVAALADAARANQRSVAALLAGSLVLAWLAWRYLVERVLGRLQAVSDTLRRGEAGELGERPRVPVEGGDEIGEMARAVERLLEDRRRLAEANRELEAFSYSVSHDLRAPLRHVDGFVTLLRRRLEGMLDPPARHYLDAIAESARRMALLVDGLLSFLQMRRARLTLAPVSLAALVREVVADLAPETAGREVAWTLGDLPELEGDREMLRLALRHLLANAVKFTRPRERAEIEVGVRPPDGADALVVFVRDNGVGFDMKHADKLFQVFHRLHGAEEFAGAGIGLANVRRVVERHGGRVWAEGVPDAGATFFLAFPARGAAARSPGR